MEVKWRYVDKSGEGWGGGGGVLSVVLEFPYILHMQE